MTMEKMKFFGQDWSVASIGIREAQRPVKPEFITRISGVMGRKTSFGYKSRSQVPVKIFSFRINFHLFSIVNMFSVQSDGGVSPRPIYWMEYDWMGDNIYYANLLGSIALCSRRTVQCVEIRNRSGETGNKIRSRMALDPPRGYETYKL